ncbi:MAG TPA: S-layer protein, partial [Methanoregulaceae archaeon]|nr:S-layer protein [Methanoregulaceae archaeon]
MFFMPVQATAADSSVIVADYSITPAVLQPGDLGTITATIRNTASTASLIRKENQVGSGGSLESTRSTDIAVEIENVRLGGDGVEVISGENRRIGAIGPGESVPVTFLVR